MNREVKRVPLNFKWGLNTSWSGYVNPFTIHDCKDCESGWSKDYEDLKDLWYYRDEKCWKLNPYGNGRYNTASWCNNITQEDVQALVDANRLWDFTRVPLNDEQKEIVRKNKEDGGNSWLPFYNGYVPTAKEVNEWSLKGFGHDTFNCTIVIKARLKKEGKSYLCSTCDGDNVDWQHPRAKEDYENWVKYEPPSGEGFQLWETTSPGSPITPVFETLELLCEYCEEYDVSSFGKDTLTKEEWLEVLKQ